MWKDDIVVKLPVLILYGSEEYWEVEEKERMVGDQDAFGSRKEEEDVNEDYNKDILEVVPLAKIASFYRCKLSLNTVEDIMINVIVHIQGHNIKS